MDRILQFFDPLPLRGQFYTLSVDKKYIFWPPPPHLVHIVIECPLKKVKAFTTSSFVFDPSSTKKCSQPFLGVDVKVEWFLLNILWWFITRFTQTLVHSNVWYALYASTTLWKWCIEKLKPMFWRFYICVSSVKEFLLWYQALSNTITKRWWFYNLKFR